MRFMFAAPVLCPLLLAACGGSGANFETTPIAAAGFAAEGRDISGDYSYRLQGTQRTLISSDQVVTQVRTDDLALTGTVGEGPITLTLNGETYTLERSPENETTYENGDDFIGLYTALEPLDSVVAVSLFGELDGNYDTGAFVLGYDTDPADVAKLSGTATFNGAADVTFRRGFDDAFGTGTVTFLVDFSNDSISGDGVITDRESSVADFTFSDLTIAFEQTDLVENGFSGAFTMGFGEEDIAIDAATYEGRLFGEDADEIGGQFHGATSENGTFIDGVFVASE